MRTSRSGFVGWGLVFLLGSSCAATLSLAGDKDERSSAILVRIEILPGEPEKWIDPILAERVPVAVFGGSALDVRAIDPATLVLASAAVAKDDDGSLASYRDVDGDGITDLVAKFHSSRIRIDEKTTHAVLTGRTRDGRSLLGSGAVGAVEKARAVRRLAAPIDGGKEKLPPIRVRIDVLPGDVENAVELGNRGTLSVAILSDAAFDATRLDPSALHLAGAPVTRRKGGGLSSVEDVDADGRADLVVEVPRKLVRLGAGANDAVLTGFTPEGRFLTGSDRVRVAETATLTFDSDDPPDPARPDSVEFDNAAAITINDAVAATPYPSTITVTGLSGVVSRVRVTLRNLTHSYPNDIDVLLVGPTGQSLILMSDVGGTQPGVSGVNLTFDDDAALTLDPGVNPVTGTYRPINFATGDAFPAPAPAPSAATALQAFSGMNPNGTWRLYVVDDAGGDTGTMLAGWTVDFVMATEFCNSGPVTINDAIAATPYPSGVLVSGMTGLVSKVTASFKGLTHSFPRDIDALLVGPTGEKSMLMSDVGGTNPGVSGVTLVLDDVAALSLDPSSNPPSGTYRPADSEPGESLPGPAPAGPYPIDLTVFRGKDPNGTWNLYVADDTGGDIGSIGRFCLAITTIHPIANSNMSSITIPAGAPGTTTGAATPYPSNIDVSGVLGNLLTVTATVHGFSHTDPRDIDLLLTAPNNRNVLLMSDVGGGNPGVSPRDYTFDDAAPVGSMPTFTNPPSGSYKPTNDDTDGNDALPAPAPAGPYGTTLAALTGLPPNGRWSLYAFDDTAGDVGSIASGWTLTMRTWLEPIEGCHPIPMTIPGGAPGTTSGAASPYPLGFIIPLFPVDLDQQKVQIELRGLTHSYPRDLDFLLVGPQGHKVMFMSDAGGSGPGVSNVNLIFDDDATSGLAELSNPVSGTYRPTDFEPGDVMPGAAPAGPYASSFSVFKGTNPMGPWNLYVADDATGDVGSLTSWCLRFITSIDAADVPNLRFRDKTTATWDAGPNATSYNFYSGASQVMPLLVDHGVDSCLRGQTTSQELTGLGEIPEIGSFYWFVVRGSNAQGEGPAGLERLAGQVRARIMDSSGACP